VISAGTPTAGGSLLANAVAVQLSTRCSLSGHLTGPEFTVEPAAALTRTTLKANGGPCGTTATPVVTRAEPASGCSR